LPNDNYTSPSHCLTVSATERCLLPHHICYQGQRVEPIPPQRRWSRPSSPRQGRAAALSALDPVPGGRRTAIADGTGNIAVRHGVERCNCRQGAHGETLRRIGPVKWIPQRALFRNLCVALRASLSTYRSTSPAQVLALLDLAKNDSFCHRAVRNRGFKHFVLSLQAAGRRGRSFVPERVGSCGKEA